MPIKFLTSDLYITNSEHVIHWARLSCPVISSPFPRAGHPPPGCWGRSLHVPVVQTETAAGWPLCPGPRRTCGTSPARWVCRRSARWPLPPRPECCCPACPPADSLVPPAAPAASYWGSRSVHAAHENREVCECSQSLLLQLSLNLSCSLKYVIFIYLNICAKFFFLIGRTKIKKVHVGEAMA